MGKGGSKPKPSKAEKALAERSALEFNHYVQNYRGPEAQLLEELRTTQGEREAAAGMASGEVEAAASGLSRANTAAQLASGAQASSGRSILGEYGTEEVRGSGRADAAARAVQAADDQELRGLTKMAAFGRGLAEGSTQNLAREAQTATSLGIAKAKAKQQERMALFEAAGTMAGAYAMKEGGLFDKIKAKREEAQMRKKFKTEKKPEYGGLTGEELGQSIMFSGF